MYDVCRALHVVIHEVEDAVYLLAPGKTCWLQALPAMLGAMGLMGRFLLDADYLCFADLAQDEICDPGGRFESARKAQRGPILIAGLPTCRLGQVHDDNSIHPPHYLRYDITNKLGGAWPGGSEQFLDRH